MVSSPKNRRRLLKLLRAIVYSFITIFLCWQVWLVRHGLGDRLSSVGWSAFGLAAGFSVVGTFPGFFAWRLLITGSGVRLRLSDAAWIFFLSEVTHYLPGGVWPTVTQVALARRVGAPATKLIAAGLVALILTMLSGVMVGLLAFPHLAAADPMWWLMLPILFSAGAIMLAPRLLRRLLGLGQRILWHGEHEIALPSGKTSTVASVISVFGWCCNGIHVAIIAIALGAPPTSAMALGMGGFALSSVAGALSLAPAGIGIREVVLGLTFGVLVSGPDLVTLLLLSRVLTTLGHVAATLGVLGLLAGIRYVKWRPSKEKSSDALSAS